MRLIPKRIKKKQTILDRYEINAKNQVVIDVSIKSVESLYHDFDKTAPYHRKELDEEFVNYISKCVTEIGKSPFIIQLSLEKLPDENLESRIRKSINGHYVYLSEVERRSMRNVFHRSMILFIVGFILLALAIIATRKASAGGVVEEVFAQGLTIAAWVSLWEALVNVFLDWLPHHNRIKLYNKIMAAEIFFRPIETSSGKRTK